MLHRMKGLAAGPLAIDLDRVRSLIRQHWDHSDQDFPRLAGMSRGDMAAFARRKSSGESDFMLALNCAAVLEREHGTGPLVMVKAREGFRPARAFIDY